MRHVISDQLGDFAAIYDEDVEIVSVASPQVNMCKALSKQLVQSRQFAELRWIQSVDDPSASTRELPRTIEGEVRAAICDQIFETSKLLGELVECEEIGVRLETLTTTKCPRFHVDHIPCRMLLTLHGVGTEWIPNPYVDWQVFDNLDTMEPPVESNRQINRLTTGHWSILKGGGWNEHFRGVVHRSPSGVSERLLLALDPIV